MPNGVHVGVLALDGMMITPSCQYDSTAKEIRGLLKPPRLEDLFEIFKQSPKALRTTLIETITAENMATTAMQVLLTLPHATDLPPVPLYYELRGKWADENEVIAFLKGLKKKLEVCEACYHNKLPECRITLPPNALNPDLFPCDFCKVQGSPCKRLTIPAICSDCEVLQAKAAKMVNAESDKSQMAMFPDPIHVTKSFKNTLINWVVFRHGKLASLDALLAVVTGECEDAQLFFEQHIPQLRAFIRSRDKHDPTQILALAAASEEESFMSSTYLTTDILSTVFPTYKTAQNPFNGKNGVVGCTSLGNFVVVLTTKKLFVVQLRRDARAKELPTSVLPSKSLNDCLGLFIIKDYLIVYTAESFYSLPWLDLTKLGTRKNYRWQKVHLIPKDGNSLSQIARISCACAGSMSAANIYFMTASHQLIRGVFQPAMKRKKTSNQSEPTLEVDYSQQPSLEYTELECTYNIHMHDASIPPSFRSFTTFKCQFVSMAVQNVVVTDSKGPYRRLVAVMRTETGGLNLLGKFKIYLQSAIFLGRFAMPQDDYCPLQIVAHKENHQHSLMLLTTGGGIFRLVNEDLNERMTFHPYIRDATSSNQSAHDDLVTHARVDASAVNCMTLVGESLVLVESGCIRICSSPLVLFKIVNILVPYIDVFQLWTASSRPNKIRVEYAKKIGSDIKTAKKTIDNIIGHIAHWFKDNNAHAGLSDDLLDEDDDLDLISAAFQDEGVSPVAKADGARGTLTVQLQDALKRTVEGLVHLEGRNYTFKVEHISTLRLEHLFGTMRENPAAGNYPTALEYVRVYSKSIKELLKKSLNGRYAFLYSTWVRTRRYNQPTPIENGRTSVIDILPKKSRRHTKTHVKKSQFKNAAGAVDMNSFQDARRARDRFTEALYELLAIYGKPVKQNRIRAFSKHAAGVMPYSISYNHRDMGKSPPREEEPDFRDGDEDEMLQGPPDSPSRPFESNFADPRLPTRSLPVGIPQQMPSLSRADSRKSNASTGLSRSETPDVSTSILTEVRKRGRPKGSVNKNTTAIKSTAPTSSRGVAAASTKQGQKKQPKNSLPLIDEKVYRKGDIVESKVGGIYKLNAHIYRTKTSKALRPAVVECYALDPDQGPGYVSLTKSKWLVNKKIMALNSKDIYVLRKDFEPDLRVADAYSSRISVPVHASSQGKDSTLTDDDEEDNEDDVDDDDVNEDDVNEDDDI